MKQINSPYLERTIKWLNAYEEDLWNHLERVPELDPNISKIILSYFLELACQAQNVANIEIGRNGIFRLPKEWVLTHIEQLAEPLLKLNEEWEYRRLFELYFHLEKQLARNLALRAIKNPNSDIKEAGEDFLHQLKSPNI